ncbi:MAG: ATP-binding protein, partial [Succinatimonas hippei]|nr:ATP-binding protein [Succinatimonas hippei]
MESTRSIGYSLQAAIADIVDNSIAADAHNINIQFP